MTDSTFVDAITTAESSDASHDATSDLSDSLFQIPIRRLPTRLDVIEEGYEYIQDKELKKDCDTLDTSSDVESWANVLTPTSSSSDDELNMNSVNEPPTETICVSHEPTTTNPDHFYEAVSAGDIDMVEACSDLSTYINRENDDGITPLVLALRAKEIGMVRVLLENGANVHQRVQSVPPIVQAILGKEEAPQFIQLLLDFGANPHIPFSQHRCNALHYAAGTGMVDAVDFLAAKGMAINEVSSYGRTPLTLAAQRGYLAITKILVAKGADIHARTDGGATPLLLAAYNGHVEIVKFLLDHGADVNSCNNNGYGALTTFSSYGNLEGVQLLLSRGAEINVLSNDAEKMTPIMEAALYGHSHVVKLLIEHGADLGILNGLDQTVLGVAFLGGHYETICILLKVLGGSEYPLESVALQLAMANSRTTTKSLMDTVALMFSAFGSNNTGPKLAWMDWVLSNGGDIVKPHALETMMATALHDENVYLVSELLSHGYNPDQHLACGNTPLSFAVDRHNAELVSILLQAGADPDFQTSQPQKFPRTPLHKALIALQKDLHKDTTIVDLLLNCKGRRLMKGRSRTTSAFYFFLHTYDSWKHGSAEVLLFRMLNSHDDINGDRADDGSTLMHAAVAKGRLDIVEILLSLGADINIKNQYGRPPLFASPFNGEMIQSLVERGANAFATDHNGENVLHGAAYLGSIKDINYLVDLELNIESISKVNHTPLTLAATAKKEEAALHLMDRGADATIKSQTRQRTLLHVAAYNGLHKLLDRLLENKSVDINAQDERGWTPLALACRKDITSNLGLKLIQAGADMEIPTTRGDRPLHIALLNENDAMARVLLSHGASTSARDSENLLPLHLAVDYRCVSAMEELVRCAEDIDVVGGHGQTALLRARDLQMTRLLLKHGANVNFVDPNGWTALHAAVELRRWDIFEVLLKAGADLEARVYPGNTTKNDGLSVRDRIECIGDSKLRAEFWYTILEAGPKVLQNMSTGEQERIKRGYKYH